MMALIIVGIGIVLLIVQIITISTSWYYTSTTYTDPTLNSQCIGYQLLVWNGCNLVCSGKGCSSNNTGCLYGEYWTGFPTAAYCTSPGCPQHQLIFTSTFVLLLLAWFIFLAAVILYVLPLFGFGPMFVRIAYILGYVTFVFIVVALLVLTFGLTPAVKKDAESDPKGGSCSGGPCDTWTGSKVNNAGVTLNEAWGPDVGWYFGLIGAGGVLFWTIFACFCCPNAHGASDERSPEDA